MTTMVCFHAGGAAYCMPVSVTRAVLRSTGLIALPAPHPDVAGVMPGTPPLTVIAPLGAGGDQVLVVENGTRTFGLLVDAVTGLRSIDDADIHPAPQGQDRELISGTIDSWGELVLVTDTVALAARL